jgi:hypothetical protein
MTISLSHFALYLTPSEIRARRTRWIVLTPRPAAVCRTDKPLLKPFVQAMALVLSSAGSERARIQAVQMNQMVKPTVEPRRSTPSAKEVRWTSTAIHPAKTSPKSPQMIISHPSHRREPSATSATPIVVCAPPQKRMVQAVIDAKCTFDGVSAPITADSA